MILKTKAPATPHKIICLLFFGTKLAAIKPIITALSAAKIISIKIIWAKIMDCSNTINLYIYYNCLNLNEFNFKNSNI